MRLPETVTIGVSELSRNPMTFRVRYSRPLRFRVWLAMRLIYVAAWFACGSVDVQPEGEA